MQYIKRQLTTVEAVKYNGVIDDNVIKILEGCSGLYYFILNDLFIYNELNKPHLVVDGEMIVLYNNGLLGVLDENEFLESYKEVCNESIKMDLAVSAESGGLVLN